MVGILGRNPQPAGRYANGSQRDQDSLSMRHWNGDAAEHVAASAVRQKVTPETTQHPQRRRQEELMDAITDEIRIPADIDAQPLVRAAASLRPVLRRCHEQIECEQRLPPDLVAELHAAGFYRMVIPSALGGLQVDPLTYLRVVEL